MTNSHLIGKQIMELEISSSKNAYAIQQTISDLVWNALVPKMSDLFDSIVNENEVIQLDKIELDLGEISLQEGNINTIVDQLAQLLMEQCTRKIQEINAKKHLNFKGTESQSQQPLRSYYFKVWIHWLTHGTLPTYAATPKENWLDEVMATLAIEDKAIEQLKALLHEYPMALNRLVLQHKAKELKSLVELYTGFSQTNLIAFFNEIRTLLKQEYPTSKQHTIRTLEVDLWKTVFRQVILKRARIDSNTISKIIVQQPEIWIFKADFTRKDKKYNKLFPMLSKTFQKAITNKKTETKAETIENKVKTTENKTTETKTDNQSNTKVKTDDQPNTKAELPSETAESTLSETAHLENTEELSSPQFFTNAGIVLLHPFIKNFFEKLNLLKDSTFKNFESQCKAVLLLHFLAGGEENINDYELVLLKFMCGMPANLPLDHSLKLSEMEKEEGINLLQAVINHWGALGSTTPDGLREGFLVRKGKLTKDHTGWRLHVEQKTLDILLDKLPWNLSMIKLPWMNELLYVQWR